MVGQVFLGGAQHLSTALGASATFTFNGTAVWYFCNQQEKGTIVDIRVDGGEPELIDTESTGGRSVCLISDVQLEVVLRNLSSLCRFSHGARLACRTVLTPSQSLT